MDKWALVLPKFILVNYRKKTPRNNIVGVINFENVDVVMVCSLNGRR